MSRYRYDDDYEGSGKESEWNAAAQQAQRTHILQERINNANLNLLYYNIDFGIYNYELLFRSCNSLFLEVFPKLDDEERAEGILIRDTLIRFFKMFPIHKSNKNLRTGKYHDDIEIKNWELVEPALRIWEQKVKTYVDEHGMNSPNKEYLQGL